MKVLNVSCFVGVFCEKKFGHYIELFNSTYVVIDNRTEVGVDGGLS